MAYKRLFTATHWVCDKTGEEVKLTHNIKAVYTHKMDQYKSFTKKHLPYHESHQRVADIIGVSLKTVEEVAIPLLKRMGLIHIKSYSTRNHITTMYPLNKMKGKLINKKLSKHTKRASQRKEKKNDEQFTYENMEILKHNSRQMDRLRGKSDEKVYLLTLEDMDRLRGSKAEESGK